MRVIAHLDMDAFFAAIEERDHPRLRGKPIVVGSDPLGGQGRGVVSTANYAAREYGIRSALPISTAWKLAEVARKKGLPAAVFMEGNMRRYGVVSREIMTILHRHAEHVEEASVDEAYFDLSFAGSYERAIEIGHLIKDEINIKEHLTASLGIGPNKLIAKIASDREKPNGFTVVREEDAEKFLEPLPIRSIPGIGPKTEEQFKKLGIRIIRDAKKFSREELHEMLGKWGDALYEKLRGRSESAIVEEWESKSVSAQETFFHDTRDPFTLQETMKALAVGVHADFKKQGFASYRGIAITVRFADFTNKSRSETLKKPTDDLSTLQFESLRLLMPFFDSRENPGRKSIRLIGVRVDKLL